MPILWKVSSSSGGRAEDIYSNLQSSVDCHKTRFSLQGDANSKEIQLVNSNGKPYGLRFRFDVRNNLSSKDHPPGSNIPATLTCLKIFVAFNKHCLANISGKTLRKFDGSLSFNPSF